MKRKIKSKGIWSRVLLYGVLASFLVFYYFNFYSPQEVIQPPQIEGLKKENFNLQYSGNRSARFEPEQFVKYMKDITRVMPDKRIVIALINLAHNLDHKNVPTKDLLMKFEDGHWFLKDGDTVKYKLPEDMGPEEYFKIAHETIQSLRSSSKISSTSKVSKEELQALKTEVDSFEYPRVMKALLKLNEYFDKNPDIQVFGLISKGTTVLALHTASYFIDNTELEGKALCLFSILKTFVKDGLEEDEALIAYMLGYKTYLSQVVGKLKNKGSFEYLVSNDMKKFEEYIYSQKRPLRDVFLFVQALASVPGASSYLEYHSDKLLKEYGAAVIPGISKTSLKRFTFSFGFTMAGVHLKYLEQSFLQEEDSFLTRMKQKFLSKPTSLELPELYSLVEKTIKENETVLKDKLFDETDYSLFYRSLLYDLMAKQGNQYIKVYSSREGTEKFIDSLSAYQTAHAQLYKKYLEATYEAYYGNPRGYYKLDDLIKYNATATYRLFDLYDILNGILGDTNPHLPIISILMNRKLDSRPEFSHYVFKMNYDLLFNPSSSYKTLKRQLRFDPEGERETAYKLKYMDDPGYRMEDVLADSTMKLDQKYDLLNLLNLLTIEEEKPLLLQKIEANTQDLNALLRYSSILKDEQKYQEARDLLIKHASYFESANDLSLARVMSAATHLSLNMNLLDQAEKDVEIPYQSYSGNGLETKATVLEAQKRYEEAAEVIRAIMKRYPKTHYHEELAKYLLLQRKDQEAVSVLVSGDDPNQRSTSFEQLGEVLLAVKKVREDFAIDAFLGELVKKENFLLNLPKILEAFSKADHHDEAIGLLKKFTPSKVTFDYNSLSYRYDEDWARFIEAEKYIHFLTHVFARFVNAKKIEEGLEFVKSAGGEKVIPYIFIAFRDFDANAKFNLFKQITSKTDSVSQFAALSYAAYYVSQLGGEEEVKQALTSYFSDPEIKSFYYQMGKFLLTGEGHENAIALSKQERKQISLYYFTGVYYDSKNDLQKANEWYQAGIYEGTYSYERSWLLEDLKKWKKRFRSLSGLLKERRMEYEKLSFANPYYVNKISEIDQMLANQN